MDMYAIGFSRNVDSFEQRRSVLLENLLASEKGFGLRLSVQTFYTHC
jgi:hypothetical protein